MKSIEPAPMASNCLAQLVCGIRLPKRVSDWIAMVAAIANEGREKDARKRMAMAKPSGILCSAIASAPEKCSPPRLSAKE